jgi:hypothetical protein
MTPKDIRHDADRISVLSLFSFRGRRSGARFGTALRIITADAGSSIVGEPEGCHAGEYIIPVDQGMHQCGGQMGQEESEEEQCKNCVRFP